MMGMTVRHQARATRVGTLSNHRGAAFLLAVYVAALTFLLLSLVSLQRTNLEARAAQIFRDVQQAFWLAEAGLDHVLALVNSGKGLFAEGVSFPCGSTTLGQPQCTVQTVSSALTMDSQGPVLETVYHIIATSQQNGTAIPGRAEVIVKTQSTFLGGMTTNGGITISHRDWHYVKGETLDEPVTVKGHILTPAGQRDTVDLEYDTTLAGNITLGPPASESGYTRLIGQNPGDDTNSQATDGIYLDSAYTAYDLPAAKLTGSAKQQPSAIIPPPQVPKECQDLANSPMGLRSMVVNTGEHVYIRDGYVDPHDSLIHDMTPSGDGQVLLCVKDVYVDENARIDVQHPTLLYVVPGTSTSYFPFDNEGMIRTGSTLGARRDRGFTVVGIGARYQYVYPGDFEGAIYAPTMQVDLGPSSLEYYGKDCETCTGDTTPTPTTRHLGFVVADGVEVEGVDLDFGIRQKSDGLFYDGTARRDNPVSVTSTLVEWTSSPMALASSLPDFWANSWWANAMGTAAQHGTIPTSSPPSGGGSTTTTTTASGTTTSTSSGGGGGTHSVICTELYRQGYLPPAWFEADAVYGLQYVDRPVLTLYQAWASRVVWGMQHSRIVTQLVRPFGVAWAHHMAYLMGASDRDDLLGHVLMDIGLPLHRLVAAVLASSHRTTPHVITALK